MTDNFTVRIPQFGEVLTEDEVKTLLPQEDFDYEAIHRNFEYRREYIKNCGFVLWTESMMKDFAGILGKDKWLEVMSGSGYFGTTINKLYGTNVIMTDNHNEEYVYKYWDKWHNDTVENLNAVDAIDKYRKEIKGVIMSWPPYETPDGFEVAKKCYECDLPLIYIGEGIGGCTADNNFFSYIGEYFEPTFILEATFMSFDGIHDWAELYTPIK